jgi:hypothetical protein
MNAGIYNQRSAATAMENDQLIAGGDPLSSVEPMTHETHQVPDAE